MNENCCSPGKTDVAKVDGVGLLQVVQCPRLSPAAMVTFNECKTCEYHLGIILVMENKLKMKRVEDVRCQMPIGRRITYLVEGAIKNGST